MSSLAPCDASALDTLAHSYSNTSLIRATWDQGVSVTKKMPVTGNMYIVYSHVPLKAKSRDLVSLEKPEEGEATTWVQTL